MKVQRKITKEIKIANLAIGGENKIAIQSMTCCDTADFDALLSQVERLEKCGCDIVRFTVADMNAVKNIAKIKEKTDIPLVADIHFDYKLALESCYAGIDKIRINPGNIGDSEKIKAVVNACRERNVPIRIGVNSGSLSKEILNKYKAASAEALFESAAENIRLLEKFDFYNTVVSVKSSNVDTMIEANRLLSQAFDYPLHIGVTEAGIFMPGLMKSAIGIGTLLREGIGDTVRVSLSDDIENEVKAAKYLLSICGRSEGAVDIVSCPTCGRTKIDLIKIATELSERVSDLNLQPKRHIKVAVMGCAVNGPGEAREADVGIAGGNGEALLFKKGVPIKKIPQDIAVNVLIDEIKKLAGSKNE